jgi:hypothetical protein
MIKYAASMDAAYKFNFSICPTIQIFDKIKELLDNNFESFEFSLAEI